MVSVRLDLTRVRSSPIQAAGDGIREHGAAVGTRRGAHRFGWLPDVRAAALNCSGYAVTFLVSRLLLRAVACRRSGIDDLSSPLPEHHHARLWMMAMNIHE
jgi:hypothetical protein